MDDPEGCGCLIVFVLLVGAFLGFVAWTDLDPVVQPQTIQSVTRVFTAGYNYSVLIENPETHVVEKFGGVKGNRAMNQDNTLVVADVEPHMPMYIDIRPNETNNRYPVYTIHIHSSKEVDGGPFRSGKNSTTQTEVVE